MSTATLNINEVLTKWRRDVNYTFVRGGRFGPYTGSSATSIIRVYKDLEAGGRSINIPLVDQLRSDGVSTGQLTGREEGIDNYGMPLYADWARNAVVMNKATEKEAAFEIQNTVRPLLTNWLTKKQRDEYIQAFLSIPTGAAQPGRLADPGNPVNGLRWGGNGGGNGATFGSGIATATAAQKNLWATANDDRIVYGSLNANKITGNVSASLANLTTASGRDRMTAAIGSFAKSIAQQTTTLGSWPAITPYQQEGEDQEWFVCFMGSRAFRDLKSDPVMYQANRDAREREKDPTNTNPLFTGGGLVYDGVIYREIPEFDALLLQPGVGASSADVAPYFLCGQNALGLALGQEARPTKRDETDYGFLKGAGIEAQYGIGKIAKAPTTSAGAVGDLKDWGMVTGWVAAPANP